MTRGETIGTGRLIAIITVRGQNAKAVMQNDLPIH